MSDATDNPDRKRWGCGTWALVIIGCLLALWVGGCTLGEAIDAWKMGGVKPGMTPAEVEALLGAPIQKMHLGEEGKPPQEYVYSYRGFGERIRIDVTFDSDLKVIRVTRYSLAPSWLRHMVG